VVTAGVEAAAAEQVEEESVRFDDLPSEKPSKKGKRAKAATKEALAAAAAEKPHLGAIRYGLAAIKNVGEPAMQAAISERTQTGAFTSLEDFCSRVDSRKISKKAIECLIKCGAFDFTGAERAQLFSEIDGAMAAAAIAHRDKAAGQFSMFDVFETAPKPATKNTAKVTPWPLTEKLAYEKELLGFYVTGHPLDEYRPLLEGGKYVPIAHLAAQEDKSSVVVAGALISVEKKFTKKESKPFAVVVLEDLTDQLEVMVWNETFNKAQQHLVQGGVVSITGRLSLREEGARITADEIKPLKKPPQREGPLVLTFEHAKTTEEDLVAVRDTLAAHPGSRQVEMIFVGEDGRRLKLIGSEHLRVAVNDDVRTRLAPWMTS
jgi:DNA polymerase-3 subunit alpha